MRILVTGHTGLLGSELVPVLQADHDVEGCSLPEWDITDPSVARKAVRDWKADLVIHAAAFTAVDECEKQPDLAYRVNALGTRNMVVAAREAGARIAYVSTDYVFDGTKGEPYVEFDAVNPLSVYGRSKWAGEQFVRYLATDYVIVRSAWLFGAGGPCFPDTILRLLREKGTVDVVDDQTGNPTYAPDLARAVARVALEGLPGTYHAVNAGAVSWFAFARKIAETFGVDPESVRPTTTEKFPRPAPRPPRSPLRNFVLEETLGHAMRPWMETLAEYRIAHRRAYEASA